MSVERKVARLLCSSPSGHKHHRISSGNDSDFVLPRPAGFGEVEIPRIIIGFVRRVGFVRWHLLRLRPSGARLCCGSGFGGSPASQARLLRDSPAVAEFVQGADTDHDAIFCPQPVGDFLVRPAASPQFSDEREVRFEAARTSRCWASESRLARCPYWRVVRRLRRKITEKLQVCRKSTGGEPEMGRN